MKHVDLSDKYDLTKTRVFLTGTQALIRLCLLQVELDKRAGLTTAGYVSGYRGSPLGGLDLQFPRAKAELEAANVVFEPGLNEDLAATAIWGTQQAELRGEGAYDGVFGMWYGKGPGVDRSGDAFRHGNLAGTSPNGGVLVLMGDDHTCESSTTSHQSEYALVDAMMPIFNPANIQDMLAFGLHGWALSRYAGVWCGLKCVKDNVESSGSIDAGVEQYSHVIPKDHVLPEGGLNIRLNDPPPAQEARLHRHKLEAVKAYVRANGLDQVVMDGGDAARIGIVSTGKSYMDVLQALEELGIDAARAEALGVALYKVAMPWPLEPRGIEAFATGLDLLVVVEEKRGLMEDQIRSILYGSEDMPQVIGKRDEAGDVLFQSEAALNPVQIAAALGARIARLTGDADLTRQGNDLVRQLGEEMGALSVARKPYFCAGCPHNSSTIVPEGSRAYAGIGCHYLAQFMERETSGYTHMGAEGANWIGESKFSTRDHVFQNVGDGTFNHSGLLALRAAVGSGANMTLKILYNDAVALTGGQTHEGDLDVYRIAHETVATGVVETVVVADDPARIERARLPKGVTVHGRGALQEVQRRLAGVKGVTALIYDQTCAAEKRRRRKRGTYPDPAKRVFINPDVCEGCGDCGVQSNCVAILPLETAFGTKRQIDQSACNKDFSCLKGFCPSFVTIEGAELRKPQAASAGLPEVPEPDRVARADAYSIVLTGVGGTGVVTIGALLGMAAHLEGKGCGIIDMAGLAQKGGAVVSHIKIGPDPEAIKAIRIARGGADLLLGCDMVTAASPEIVQSLGPDGHAVVNSFEMVTGDFTRDPGFALPVNLMHTRIKGAVPDGQAVLVNGTHLATRLIGDSIATNLFMLGVAYQRGLVPVSAEAIFKAIDLNGVAVEASRLAFQKGRHWVVDPGAVEAEAGAEAERPADRLEDVIAHRDAHLTAYQSAAYARKYRKLVDRVVAADPDPAQRLSFAVARNLAKVMTYKDEYEVARLYGDGEFLTDVMSKFDGEVGVRLHLAPPVLARIDPATGRPKKRAFGVWVLRLFRLLARGKRLRGTPFDPFGFTAERWAERALRKDYSGLVAELADAVATCDYEVAVALAEGPDAIRGFGPVKAQSMETARSRQTELRQRLKHGKTAAEHAA